MGHTPSSESSGATKQATPKLRTWAVIAGVVPSVFAAAAAAAVLRGAGGPFQELPAPYFIAAALLLVGLAAQAWCIRHLMKNIHALSIIGETLTAWSDGEPDAEALRITDNDAPATAGWNRLVTQMAKAHLNQTTAHAVDTLASSVAHSADQDAVLDALPHGVVIVDAHRNLTVANGAACRMLMRSRERLVGAPIDKLAADEELLALVDNVLNSSDTRGGGIEITLNPEQDQQAVVRVTVRPLGRSTQHNAIIVLEDVTQQRTADQSRNLFVAQATHELRTPLTNIGLYLERAIDLDDDATADRAECLNVINSEVIRLGRVVEEVLSVSEIEAGSFQVRRDDVRIDELLTRLEEEYAAQANEKSVVLSFDLPPKLSVVHGDRDKITVALHNLIGNALKYTSAGGTARVSVQETDQGIEVAITDTGIGIAEADLPKVFEKFYRADDPRLRDIGGSGLGLALAREVIRLHGGDITVESIFNEGSTFTLRLPIDASVPAAA